MASSRSISWSYSSSSPLPCIESVGGGGVGGPAFDRHDNPGGTSVNFLFS
jgi:hypothetical protein